MAYQVFISHTSADKSIAEEVKRIVNNAFSGTIRTYLAFQELKSGDDWKHEIRKNLKNCDAIISILTPEAMKSPWLFIEWSCFWLADKKYYILLDNTLRISDLPLPMQERMVTVMSEPEQLQGFFRALTRDSGHGVIPFEFTDEFIDSVNAARWRQQQRNKSDSYDKYQDSLTDLPNDDTHKKEAAEYFYQQGSYDVFQKLIAEIRTDLVKSNIAVKLIETADLNHLAIVTRCIRASSHLGKVARSLIEHGYTETSQLREMLEDIAKQNQTESRAIGIYLAQLGMEETALFRYNCELITNMAEFKKIPQFLVDNNRVESPVFRTLIDRLADMNRIELRKVGSHFILSGLQRSQSFLYILQILCERNKRQARILMAELADQDAELHRDLVAQGILTDNEKTTEDD